MAQAQNMGLPLKDISAGRLADMRFSQTANGDTAIALGRWVISELAVVDTALRQWRPTGPVVIDLGALERLDTAGAWILYRTRKQLRAQDLIVEFANVQPEHAALLARVEVNDKPGPVAPPQINSALRVLSEIGAGITGAFLEARALLGFLGLTVATLGRAIANPRRLRWTPLIYHLEII